MRNATFERRSWFLNHASARILSLVVALAGLWQIAAPFVLNFADEQTAMRNAIGTGVLLAVFAGLGTYGYGHWSRSAVSTIDWLACLTGLWLVLSPFVLQYQEVVPAFWSALIVGLVSFIIAGIIASMRPTDDAASST